MMNITVSIDDEIYRRVQIKAAELNTAVSALIQEQLADISSRPHRPVSPEEFKRLEQLEQEITKRITDFSGADRLPRDELYDRKRF
jgi:predicted transcriptional regulator